MVDPQELEPGLSEGHPWKSASRWQIAWRVFFGTSLVGMVGMLLFALTDLWGDSSHLMASLFPYMFGVLAPAIFALVAAGVGPWLKRFFPFTQALLFGGISVLAMIVLFAMLALWDTVTQASCAPDAECYAPFEGMVWAVMLFSFPVFLCGAIGYGFALWSPTRSGKRVFWWIWGLVAFVFGFLLVAAWANPWV